MVDDRTCTCRHLMAVHQEHGPPRPCLIEGCGCTAFTLAEPPEDTRRAAWEEAQAVAGTKRDQVLVLLRGTPSTSDELEVVTGWRQSTVAARVSELKKAGKVHDSGERRRTRSRRWAAVWTTAKPDDGQAELW